MEHIECNHRNLILVCFWYMSRKINEVFELTIFLKIIKFIFATCVQLTRKTSTCMEGILCQTNRENANISHLVHFVDGY